MTKLPHFLKPYFWDVEFETIDFKKYRIYVLNRILEYGDESAVKWMWHNFKKSEIREVLSKFRGFSRKSAHFWAVILGIPRREVLCLKRHSSRGPKKIWPY